MKDRQVWVARLREREPVSHAASESLATELQPDGSPRCGHCGDECVRGSLIV